MEAQVTEAPPVSPERPARKLRALMLALFWLSGSGHLAIGYRRRAWAWLGAGLAFLLIAELAAVTSGSTRFLWAAAAGAVAFHILSAIDVARLERSRPLPGPGSFFGQLALYTVVCLVVLFGYRKLLVEAFMIPSDGMFPTLRVGDHIFVNKSARHYSYGDVVVFAYPLDPTVNYVERVVGMSGDVVEQSSGDLKINGQPVRRRELEEPCAYTDGGSCHFIEESFQGRTWRIAENIGPGRDFPATTIPPGHFFMMGDNRSNSSDSRVWGFVNEDLMRGKALSIWMSSPDGFSIDWSRFNQPVR